MLCRDLGTARVIRAQNHRSSDRFMRASAELTDFLSCRWLRRFREVPRYAEPTTNAPVTMGIPFGSQSTEGAKFSFERRSPRYCNWSHGRTSIGSPGRGLHTEVGVASTQAVCHLGSAHTQMEGTGDGMGNGATATSERHGRHRRPSFGWDSLTEAELRVVELAAEGLTNRQVAERLFVSRRTVATHLEHVFQKLGFSTRVRLATEAVRRLG